MKKLMFLLFFFLITLNAIFSEIPPGNLIVAVISEQGEVLPGATITISSAVLVGTRTQSAGPTGKATFRKLPPGEYKIEVSMDGFEPRILSKVDINEGKTTKSEIALKIGKPREIVEVVGIGPIVHTTGCHTSEIGFDVYIDHQPEFRNLKRTSKLTPGVTFVQHKPGNLIVAVISEEGEVLPGATITISSAVLMGTRAQSAGSTGKATFRKLPPGEYRIEVSIDGFEPGILSKVEINEGKTTKSEIALKLGKPKEIVNIVGTGPMVETRCPRIVPEYDFGYYIDHKPVFRNHKSVANKSESVIEEGKATETTEVVGKEPIAEDRRSIVRGYANKMSDRCSNDASSLVGLNKGNLVIIVMNDVEKALSGATVTVSSPSMKVSRELLTDPSGKAIFKNMPADEYSVEVQLAGLLGVKEMGIQIVAGKTCTTIETMFLK